MVTLVHVQGRSPSLARASTGTAEDTAAPTLACTALAHTWRPPRRCSRWPTRPWQHRCQWLRARSSPPPTAASSPRGAPRLRVRMRRGRRTYCSPPHRRARGQGATASWPARTCTLSQAPVSPPPVSVCAPGTVASSCAAASSPEQLPPRCDITSNCHWHGGAQPMRCARTSGTRPRGFMRTFCGGRCPFPLLSLEPPAPGSARARPPRSPALPPQCDAESRAAARARGRSPTHWRSRPSTPPSPATQCVTPSLCPLQAPRRRARPSSRAGAGATWSAGRVLAQRTVGAHDARPMP